MKTTNHQSIQSQSGFGALGILLIIVVIAGLGGAGYYVWSQSTDSSDQAATTAADDEVTANQEEIGPEVFELDNIVRNDMNRIMVELNNYAADNNGRYPTDPSEFEAFEQDYLTQLDNHPVSDLPYSIDEAKADTHEYITYANGVCADDNTIRPADNPRQIALAAELPSGQRYCIGS